MPDRDVVKELLTKPKLERTYSCFNTSVEFSSYTAFEYRCFLYWLAKTMPDIKSAERMRIELALRNIALVLTKYGEEGLGTIPKDANLVEQLKVMIREEIGSDANIHEYKSEKFYEMIVEHFNNKYSAIKSMTEVMTSTVIKNLADFERDVINLDIDYDINKSVYKDLKIESLVFNPYCEIELKITDDLSVTFMTMDNRLRLIIEDWVDEESGAILSKGEHEHVRALKYLAGSIKSINGKTLGSPKAIAKKMSELEDHEIKKWFQQKLEVLYNLPHSVIALIDKTRADMSREVTAKLIGDELKN